MHEVNYVPDPRGDLLIAPGTSVPADYVPEPEPDTMTSLGLTTGLTAFWTLDEASGTRVDSSGNGYDLSVGGSAVSSAAGKLNNAASFDGSTVNWLGRANPALALSGGAVTISAWVKLNSVSADMGIVGKYAGGGLADGYKLYFDEGFNRFVFRQADSNGPNEDQIVSTVPVIVDVWYHIVCGYDSTNHFIAINGGVRELDDGLQSTNTAHEFKIGNDSDGMTFDGLIDEVGIWIGTVLTDQQIAALYNSGTPLPFS